MAGLDELHHANLLIGGSKGALKYVLELFEKSGEPLGGSPDFFQINDELFGVDLAREFGELAFRKPFGKFKVFLIRPESFTYQAQNALLKVFEEPPAGTYFFLNLRDKKSILPTLLSRMKVIDLKAESVFEEEALKFLASPLKERLKFVKKFVDDENNVSAFLDSLLLLLKKQATNLSNLKKVMQMRLVSDQRAGGDRLILEYLALNLNNLV